MEKKEVTKQICLRIKPSIHKDMKRYALENDISLRELVEKAFEAYKNNNK